MLMKPTIAAFAALWLTALAAVAAPAGVPPVVHSAIGQKAASADGQISLTVSGKKQNYRGGSLDTRDTLICSPKSVHFHPDGTKYYVNSLEGCVTVVYDARTNQCLGRIIYRFNAQNAHLWSQPSGLFPFTHYHKSQQQLNTFLGRPVESTFSHGGRYLWVPFYRRSYDINAQDPSAIAVIDTRADTIIRVMETGPLPKMVATSHNGRYIAVAHWGNNTVGIIDISSNNPANWHWVRCLVVDRQLTLNYSLTRQVDRDSGSGYMLRGTVFTPDDRYLLVACMGGAGGIAVIDMQRLEYLGRLTGISNARHLVLSKGWLYATVNVAGELRRVSLDAVLQAIGNLKGRTAPLTGWQTCRVGGGARTVSLSPSGRWAFVACNSASRLTVVDTRTMQAVASLPIDSYPVGLDLSSDGTRAVVTSQGRKGYGGNAVNLVTISYAQPEPTVAATLPAARPTNCVQATPAPATKVWWQSLDLTQWLLVALGVALAVAMVWLLVSMTRKGRRPPKNHTSDDFNQVD